VTLATHRPIEPDARRLGLGFAPTEGNPRQVLETEQGDAWLEAGRHPLRGTRRLLAVARPLAATWHQPAAPRRRGRFHS
jgi:hypothetical protein